jgi:hypothetical protein
MGEAGAVVCPGGGLTAHPAASETHMRNKAGDFTLRILCREHHKRPSHPGSSASTPGHGELVTPASGARRVEI